MKYWGVPTDLKASSWQTWYAGDKKRLEKAIRGYNDGLPKEKQKSELDIHLIIDAALKQFAIDKGLAINESNVFFYGDLPIRIDSTQTYSDEMDNQTKEELSRRRQADKVFAGVVNPKTLKKNDMFDGMDEMNEEDQKQQKEFWSFFNN